MSCISDTKLGTIEWFNPLLGFVTAAWAVRHTHSCHPAARTRRMPAALDSQRQAARPRPLDGSRHVGSACKRWHGAATQSPMGWNFQLIL